LGSSAFFQCFGERRQRKLGLACYQKRLGQSDLGCLSVTRTNKRCIVADDCFISCTHLEQHVSGCDKGSRLLGRHLGGTSVNADRIGEIAARLRCRSDPHQHGIARCRAAAIAAIDAERIEMNRRSPAPREGDHGQQREKKHRR
jgi:hypothetical protein